MRKNMTIIGETQDREQQKNKKPEFIVHSEMVHLGDTFIVETSWSGGHKLPGRVVFINPNRRWFTMQFTSENKWGSNTVRESFCMIPIEYLKPWQIEYVKNEYRRYVHYYARKKTTDAA